MDQDDDGEKRHTATECLRERVYFGQIQGFARIPGIDHHSLFSGMCTKHDEVDGVVQRADRSKKVYLQNRYVTRDGD